MKLLLNFFSTFSMLFLFIATAFAHETEIVHEEPVPTISPVLLVGIVAILAIGGFVLWKFVLRNPHSSSSTQTPSQEQKVDTQTKSVPENQSDQGKTPS